MEGFNISAKIGGKTVLGRTEDNLSISAVTKESLTKDDQGVSKKVITSHDVTLSMSALYSLNETGTTTKLDRDDIIELALKTGSAAQFEVTYEVTGGDTYKGNGIITGYSESSSASASEDATLSIDIEIVGGFTKVTS